MYDKYLLVLINGKKKRLKCRSYQEFKKAISYCEHNNFKYKIKSILDDFEIVDETTKPSKKQNKKEKVKPTHRYRKKNKKDQDEREDNIEKPKAIIYEDINLNYGYELTKEEFERLKKLNPYIDWRTIKSKW